MQRKLGEGMLLDMNGVLSEAGYATTHIKLYNRKNVQTSKLRIKEWDYFYVHDDSYGLGIVIADNGYMGMVSLTLINHKDNTLISKSKMNLFPLGKMNLVCTPNNGKTVYNKKGVSFNIDYDQENTHIKILWEKFIDHAPLEVDMTLRDKPQDSMVLTVPFHNKPKHFYYNQKTLGMRAEGTIKTKGIEHTFEGEALALMDYGRGVWPYFSKWLWGAAQGKVADQLIAINIGHGFGDTNAAGEDMVFVDGVGHKLDHGRFKLQKDANGNYQFLKPWTYKTHDKRLDLVFTPRLIRKDYTNLVVIKSRQNQVFGTYSGTVVLDDNTKISFKDLPGFAESFINKW